MAFLAALIHTLIRMSIVSVAAFGGICLGKYLRRRKNTKDADEIEK